MKSTVVSIVFSLLFVVVTSLEYEDFILGEPVELVKTDAGKVRILMGSHDTPSLKELDVAFSSLTLEPGALLLPHYMDASVVFYVQQGQGLVGSVRSREGKEGTLNKELQAGDVYSVPAGTVFYVLNTDDERKMELVGLHDTSAASHRGKLETFFVGGGTDPKVLFTGFGSEVLASAFKVPEEEIATVFSSQDGGAIVPTTVEQCHCLNESSSETYLESVAPNKKSKHDKHKGKDDKKRKDIEDKKHKDETFNLFEKRMFENEHGWIASTTGKDVRTLSPGRFDVSVIRLKAGSLLAPHWNPEGALFGMVTNGSGNIQIALSDGSNGVDADIKTGIVFYVPQFLPLSLAASQDESFELVTFTVSRDRATPTNQGIQFLAGRTSVLQKMDIGTLALAFDLPDHLVSSFLHSQDGSVIF